MLRLPLDPLVIAIALRYDPDERGKGYRISSFGTATVGAWHTPVDVYPGFTFADAANPLADICLRVSASEIQPFIERAKVQAIQGAAKAARKRLRDRRRP